MPALSIDTDISFKIFECICANNGHQAEHLNSETDVCAVPGPFLVVRFLLSTIGIVILVDKLNEDHEGVPSLQKDKDK